MLETLLALDTLVVAAACAPHVRGRNAFLGLALTFGLADGLASLAHTALPALTLLAPFEGTAVFGYACVVLFLVARGTELRGGVWLLPWLLTLDNLAAGGDPLTAGLTSTVAGALGLLLGRFAARRLDEAYRLPARLSLGAVLLLVAFA